MGTGPKDAARRKRGDFPVAKNKDAKKGAGNKKGGSETQSQSSQSKQQSQKGGSKDEYSG